MQPPTALMTALKEAGVAKVGHRLKLTAAVREAQKVQQAPVGEQAQTAATPSDDTAEPDLQQPAEQLVLTS